MQTVVEILTADELAQVHERTLKVLPSTGCASTRTKGAASSRPPAPQVDEATRMVRFPRALVEEALRLAPKQFSLGGRRDGFSHPLNAGEFTLLADGGATTLLDRRTGERRASHARGLGRGDDAHRRLRRRRPLLVALPAPVATARGCTASSST